jgi:hypothetical protein
MPKEKVQKRAKRTEKKKKGMSLPIHSPVAFRHAIVANPSLLDPNAPKRGLSAYMFFANEQRDNVREENPGISFGT